MIITAVQWSNAFNPNVIKLGHWAREWPEPEGSQKNNNTGHTLIKHGLEGGSFDWIFTTVVDTFIFSQGK